MKECNLLNSVFGFGTFRALKWEIPQQQKNEKAVTSTN